MNFFCEKISCKNLFYFLALLFVIFGMSGCGISSGLRRAFNPPGISTTAETLPKTYSGKLKESAANIINYPKNDILIMSPVKSVVNKLVWIFWIAGVLCILGGIALIVWGGLPIPGAKMIVCGVASPILATWFSMHYAEILFLAFAGLVTWYLLTHHAVMSAMSKVLSNAALETVATAETASTSTSKKTT